MRNPWQKFGGRLLIGLALLSLAVGPSPAAAMATLAEAIERAATAAQRDGAQPDVPDDDSTPADGGGMSTNFVAPASAKPHDVKEAVRPLTAAATSLIKQIIPAQQRAFSQTFLIGSLLPALDHSPQQPNAPPQG